MNKPKKQGTEAETRVVRLLQTAGLNVHRLPEGGSRDEGDLEVYEYPVPRDASRRYVIEVRDRQAMNGHDALIHARAKSGTHRTLLWWTRRVPGGLRRRTQRMVCMSEDTMIELLGGDHVAVGARGPRPSRVWNDEPLPFEDPPA